MKIKLPFQLPKFLAAKRKKKLRASTARKPLRIAATADYDDLAEPNMKLSRALLIVLVLHVVAVSGIIAFNAIKTRQGSYSDSAATSSASSATKENSGTAAETPRAEDARTASAAKAGAKDEHKMEHVPRALPVSASDSGKTYVVAKNDTPVSIAKKFKVSQDELLSVNHITDPHKLKIGQKLIIPAKTNKPKKIVD